MNKSCKISHHSNTVIVIVCHEILSLLMKCRVIDNGCSYASIHDVDEDACNEDAGDKLIEKCLQMDVSRIIEMASECDWN